MEVIKTRKPPVNKLNDLSFKEWMINTKSVYFEDEKNIGEQYFEIAEEFKKWALEKNGAFVKEFGQELPSVLHSNGGARDKLKSQHPATFAETDINKLITFFTKKNEWVLDPFGGVGSTLISCLQTQRNGTCVELSDNWIKIAKERIANLTNGMFENFKNTVEVIQGDSRKDLVSLNREFDFIVTSPPYWNILQKDNMHKVIAERKNKNLPTKYSTNENDLGNIDSYSDFLQELKKVFAGCGAILKSKKYMCVVVSDFRHKSKFHTFHSDLIPIINECGFSIEGITVLVQNSKNLYPYGIPYAFVSNIIHQYILVFRKNK